MSKPVSVDDNTSVAMPIRNMLAIIGAVAVGVWSYFGIVERLNISETKIYGPDIFLLHPPGRRLDTFFSQNGHRH